MRILLVEDDSATAQSIELMLKSEGMNVYSTDLGEEAVDLGKIYDYDIILLDLCLPDISGVDVIRRLRTARISTPILVLTGTSKIDTKVRCLGLGADDYMTKPFHKEELTARILAVARRSRGHAAQIIRIGDLQVDLGTKSIHVGEKPIHLTGKEYQIMEILALRQGTTLSKEQFLNHLYSGMDEPELKIIDVFICKVRKKLGPAGKYIQTVWGRGYILRGEAPPPPRPGMSISSSEIGDLIADRIATRLSQGRQASLMELVEASQASEDTLRGILLSMRARGVLRAQGGMYALSA